MNTCDRDGHCALRDAIDSGHVEVVQLLLQAGADIDAAKRDGEPALMRAARSAAQEGLAAVVQLLLQPGAGVNAVLFV